MRLPEMLVRIRRLVRGCVLAEVLAARLPRPAVALLELAEPDTKPAALAEAPGRLEVPARQEQRRLSERRPVAVAVADLPAEVLRTRERLVPWLEETRTGQR